MSNAGAEAPPSAGASTFSATSEAVFDERDSEDVGQELEVRLHGAASSTLDPAAARTEDAARSASSHAAPPLRLLQLAQDPTFLYRQDNTPSDETRAGGIGGCTKPTDNQEKMLETLGVELASSGVW
jgi:hypothetical protein